jgi:hypothetical protein
VSSRTWGKGRPSKLARGEERPDERMAHAPERKGRQAHNSHSRESASDEEERKILDMTGVLLSTYVDIETKIMGKRK